MLVRETRLEEDDTGQYHFLWNHWKKRWEGWSFVRVSNVKRKRKKTNTKKTPYLSCILGRYLTCRPYRPKQIPFLFDPGQDGTYMPKHDLPHLLDVYPMMPLKQFQCGCDWWRPPPPPPFFLLFFFKAEHQALPRFKCLSWRSINSGMALASSS